MYLNLKNERLIIFDSFVTLVLIISDSLAIKGLQNISTNLNYVW